MTKFRIYYETCLNFTLYLDFTLGVVLTNNNVKSRFDCMIKSGPFCISNLQTVTCFLLETTEIESDRLRPALLVTGSQTGEDGVVGLTDVIVPFNRISGQRVGQSGGVIQSSVGLFAEQFAGAVAQKFVEANLKNFNFI